MRIDSDNMDEKDFDKAIKKEELVETYKYIEKTELYAKKVIAIQKQLLKEEDRHAEEQNKLGSNLLVLTVVQIFTLFVFGVIQLWSLRKFLKDSNAI